MPPPKPVVIENVGLCTFLPIVICSVAVVFGTVGSIGCRMIFIPSTDPSVPPIEAGVFAYRDGSTIADPELELLWDLCRPYESLDFDYEQGGLFSAIRALAIVICALGCLTVLGMWSAPCFPIHEMAWKMYGVLFFLLGGCQIVTTQVMKTEVCTNNPRLQYLEVADPEMRALYSDDPDACLIGRGLRFCFTASTLWFIAGIVTLMTPAPKKKA